MLDSLELELRPQTWVSSSLLKYISDILASPKAGILDGPLPTSVLVPFVVSEFELCSLL